MEKRNYATALLLIIGITQVYSYPQNVYVKDAVTFAVSAQNPNHQELADYLLLNDEKHHGMKKDPAYYVDGRTKRSPGGPKNTSNKLKNLQQENRQPGTAPHQAPVNPTNRMRQFNEIVNDLMRQPDLSRDAAIQRAILANAPLINQINNMFDH